MQNIHEIEDEINSLAAKLISSKLGENEAKNFTISPFKLKQPKKGKGLGGYVNQNDQLHDFESWAGPGNFVYHVLNQNPLD